MTALEQAEQTLADLEQKRAALVDHGRELVSRRQEVSFAAHTGDAAAKKQLDKLIAEIVSHDQQVVSLDGAIATAQDRLAAARHAEAAEADKAQVTSGGGRCRARPTCSRRCRWRGRDRRRGPRPCTPARARDRLRRHVRTQREGARAEKAPPEPDAGTSVCESLRSKPRAGPARAS